MGIPHWSSALLPRSTKSLGWWAIGVAAAFAALALLGWLFGIEVLRSILPGATAMRVITIFCLLASTAALACLNEESCGLWRAHVSRAAGALVSGLGLLTVVSYLVEATTDRLWSWSLLPVANLVLGPASRMAVITALLFSVFGLILLLLGVGTRRAAGVAHVALLPVALMAYMVIAGYVLGIHAFYDWMHLGVALNTGLAFCALCLAAFCVRPDTWVMQIFAGEEAGATMARRLLPGLLLLPLAIGWLRIEGERAGLFESDLGVALVAVTYAASFLVLVWRGAGAVNRTDRLRREFEEALRESERRWATTLTSIGDGVIATDAAGSVTFLNPMAEGLTGFTQAEAAGRRVTEVFRIINEETRAEVESPVARVLREGTVVGLANHTLLVRSDGSELPIDDSGAPIRDARGEMAGVVLVFRDVSERRRAEEARRESEARYRSLFESMTEGFALHEIICDEAGVPIDYRFLEVNPAFERLTGLTREAVEGHTHNEVLPDDDPRWVQAYGEVALTGVPTQFENYSPALQRHYEVFAYRPAPRQFAVIFLDITARVETEERLRQAHALLNRHVDNSPLATVEWDGEFHIIRWAGEAERVFGWTAEEVLGKRIDELPWVYAEDLPLVEATIADMLSGRRLSNVSKNRNLRRDGQVIRCEWYNTAVRDAEGRLVSVLSQVLDVTEREQAERALRESEERYRELVRHAPAAIYEMDLEGTRFLSVNDVMCELLGHTREELLTIRPADLLDPESGALFADRMRRQRAGERVSETAEYRVRRKDGTWIDAAVNVGAPSSPDGGPARVSVIAHDVTARKRAEDALRQSRADFERAQEVGQIGWWRLDTSRNVLTWSPENHRIFGVPEGTPMSYDFFLSTVHPEDRGYVDAQWQAGLRGEPYDIEHRVVAQGRVKWVREKAYLEFEGEGNLLGGFGITQDITGRKQAEEALRESESRYRELVQRANSAIVRWRRDGTITFFNEYAQEFFGYREEEALGRDARMLLPATEVEGGDLGALVEEIVAHPEAFARNVNENVLRDGRRVWMAWTNRPIFDAAGEVAEVLAVGTDITELRQAEEALRESQAALQQSYAELEQRVVERTAELRTAYGYARRLLEASLDPLVTISPEGKITDVNAAAEEATGLSRAELTGTDFSDYFTEPEQARAGYEQVFREGSVRDYPLELRHRDGCVRSVLYNAAVYQDDAGRPIGVFAAARDVTKRRKAEAEVARHRDHLEELVQERTAELESANEQLGLEVAERKRIADAQRESEERLRFALENSHTGAWDLGLEDHTAHRSLEHDRIFGYDQLLPEWTYEMFLEHVLPEDRPGVEEKFRASMATGGDWNFECRIRRVDGEVRWIWAAGRHLPDSEGRRRRMSGIVQDITARKQAEQDALEAERARAALAQSLTSEIAHRTKNNLAIVAGLLQLQLARDDAPDLHTDLIRDAVTRIMSFAALHEQMYQRHTGEVELLDALQRIAEVDRQALSAGEIEVSVEGESAEYPASVATNLCVIANELITNAIKHGIGPGGRGQVEVRLTHREGRLVLSVWNAHNPIAADFDVRKGGRTGLSLVRSIMEDQYGGTFTLVPERGGTAACVVLDDAKLLAQ